LADETPILPAHIEDTIRAIAKLHADHHLEAGGLQRLSRLAPKSPAPETEAHLLEPPLRTPFVPLVPDLRSVHGGQPPGTTCRHAYRGRHSRVSLDACLIHKRLGPRRVCPITFKCAKVSWTDVTAAAFSASGTPRGMRRPDASRVEDEKQVTRHKHVMGESSWPG
jgi:hypothetical protein